MALFEAALSRADKSWPKIEFSESIAKRPGTRARRPLRCTRRAQPGATGKRKKTPKTAFDFGLSEAGSDALIAGPQPPSAPKRFLNTAENP
jgi:hypothetical protein